MIEPQDQEIAAMIADQRLSLIDIEQRVCDITSIQLGIPRHEVSPTSTLIEDLNCDSLDLIELFIEIEETFDVTLPEKAPNAIYKAVFTRWPSRLSDLAELVYLQQGTGRPERNHWRWVKAEPPSTPALPFTQLDGVWSPSPTERDGLFEKLNPAGTAPEYRRRSDGMRCVQIPAAIVEIGCDRDEAQTDERPKHSVAIDSFLIDAEPISTTAYCRFLNSIGQVPLQVLAHWFILEPSDDRNAHVLLQQAKDGWRALPGTERWPMILVSWYGANAYSLWANGRSWEAYMDDHGAEPDCFLPSEAQWEYAARGGRYATYPWGDEPPSQTAMRFAQHRRGVTYRADTLPLADVNEPMGLSPFGLHHMAGNVWQWCRDWYDATFYTRAESTMSNAFNRSPSRVRSERGGSWIGPSALCRSSFRRGRPPAARGRCLGFRCISSANDIARI